MKGVSNVLHQFGLSKKFKLDSLWSVIGFGVQGVSVLFINFLIPILFDIDTLGVFNILLSILILLGQFAGVGIHFSTIKEVSSVSNLSYKNRKLIFINSMIPLMFCGCLVMIIGYLVTPLLYGIYENVGLANYYILFPGVLAFAINKNHLALINGKQEYMSYSIYSALRGVLPLLTFVWMIFAGVSGQYIALLITCPELALLIILTIHNLKYFSIKSDCINLKLISKYLNHGFKSFIGTIFIDINTKIDVLVLGIYVTDHFIGIYSLASIVIEGVNQLPIIFRTLINPKITILFETDKSQLNRFIKKTVNLSYKVFSIFGLLVVLGYFMVVKVLFYGSETFSSLFVILIIMAGVFFYNGYAPFLMIFNQVGRPLLQSYIYIFSFGINLVLNLLLVPIMGMYGAAIATSVSFAIYPLVIKKKLQSIGYL